MQMSRLTRSQLLRAVEVIYAIVALVALTQGPVYRLWSESSTFLTTSPQPSMPHIYFATFVVVQLPALVLLSRRIPNACQYDRRIQVLAALLAWLGLSVTWSTLARHALPEYVSLLLTSSVGLYLAVSFTLRTFWRIVATAMSLGLLSSVWAIVRGWELSTSVEEGYWIGIYFNRNSLAPVAAVALLAGIGVILTQTSWKTLASRVVFVVAAVLMALSVVMLWQAESRTSPLAIGVAAGSLHGWLFVRWIALKFTRRSCPIAAPLAIVATAITLYLAMRWADGFSMVSDELATFNSRSNLWSLSWAGFLEKPYQGWGWMSAWHTPSFFNQGMWWVAFDNVTSIVTTRWSHNGYLDLLLSGGVLAALLFAILLWFALQEIGSHDSLREAIPSFLSVTFVMAAATQESFFIGTHFLWALLIAGLMLPRRQKDAPSSELIE